MSNIRDNVVSLAKYPPKPRPGTHSTKTKRYRYKGIEYSYEYAHKWIHQNYGKATKCEVQECPKKSVNYEWSNVSREYKLERQDWKQLCRSCHVKYDITPETKEKIRAAQMGNTKRRKPVSQFDKAGNFIASYPSMRHAEKATGIFHTSICSNVKGKNKSAGGFIWKEGYHNAVN